MGSGICLACDPVEFDPFPTEAFKNCQGRSQAQRWECTRALPGVAPGHTKQTATLSLMGPPLAALEALPAQ